MHLVILKSDITALKIPIAKPVFDSHPYIYDWNVDDEDVDLVLRIEAEDQLKEEDVISLLEDVGIVAEKLPD